MSDLHLHLKKQTKVEKEIKQWVSSYFSVILEEILNMTQTGIPMVYLAGQSTDKSG